MLVGREPERRAIHDLLAGARVGRSGALVLTGEPGIGKTSLLAEAETLAEGMQLLRAHGVESEQAVPFGGLLQLLRPVLPLRERIPGPQGDALASALLLEHRRAADPTRFAVGAATLSLLARAAEERPIAVLVDDAHLLDRPSSEALVFAARRLVSDALAVLVATRSEEPGSRPWNELPTLVVTGLDLGSASSLLLSQAGTRVRSDQVARLHRETAGNPLALLEFGSQPDRFDGVPPGSPTQVSHQLTRAFVGRIHELGEEARLALLVAAADNTSLSTVDLACRQLGLTVAALSEVEKSGLVTSAGDEIRFRHPLVRSAVYGAADSETRRRVHRALAAVVPPEESDKLAWHLSEGSVAPDELAAKTLDRVGVQASSRGAYAIATHAHERAAELTPHSGTVAQSLTAAGEAAWRAGTTDRAVDLLERALSARPESRLRARIQELQGAIKTRCGSLEDALATLVAAAADVRQAHPATAVRLLADAIHVCFYLGDPAAAMRAARTIEALLVVEDDLHSRFLGSMAAGMAEILDGAGESGVGRIRAALDLVAGRDELESDQFLLPHRIIGILWLREAGNHRSVVDEAVSRLRERAAFGTLPYLLMHLARDDATTERWDDAENSYLEGIRLARETGQSTDLAVSQAGLAWLYARQGREQECRDLVAPALSLCRRMHVNVGTAWLDFAQGDLEAGLGNITAALRHYETLEERLRTASLSDPDQSSAPEVAEAYRHLGRMKDALRVAERFQDKAVAKGQPWSLARAERAMMMCSSGPEADAHFQAAIALHERTPDRYETARTELAHGAGLRRTRRRMEARLPLRSALATFEELGARPWADRAALELEATGETAHRRQTSVIDELTPQERQISQMLARGDTTREAAAALFLSPKTVEYHLRHVYLKLGINSRAALAEWFRT